MSKNNAVIYAIHKENHEIQKQIKACEKYAKEKGYTIISKYVDTDINNRKQFQQMIKDSSKKEFQAVIIYSLDRFARNRYDNAIYKRKLKLNGVKVLSTQETLGNNASDILMESIIEGLIEYYDKETNKKVVNEG